MTLKSTLRVTQGHWKQTGQIIHDLLLNKLLDVTLKCGSEFTQCH